VADEEERQPNNRPRRDIAMRGIRSEKRCAIVRNLADCDGMNRHLDGTLQLWPRNHKQELVNLIPGQIPCPDILHDMDTLPNQKVLVQR